MVASLADFLAASLAASLAAFPGSTSSAVAPQGVSACVRYHWRNCRSGDTGGAGISCASLIIHCIRWGYLNGCRSFHALDGGNAGGAVSIGSLGKPDRTKICLYLDIVKIAFYRKGGLYSIHLHCLIFTYYSHIINYYNFF